MRLPKTKLRKLFFLKKSNRFNKSKIRLSKRKLKRRRRPRQWRLKSKKLKSKSKRSKSLPKRLLRKLRKNTRLFKSSKLSPLKSEGKQLAKGLINARKARKTSKKKEMNLMSLRRLSAKTSTKPKRTFLNLILPFLDNKVTLLNLDLKKEL